MKTNYILERLEVDKKYYFTHSNCRPSSYRSFVFSYLDDLKLYRNSSIYKTKTHYTFEELSKMNLKQTSFKMWYSNREYRKQLVKFMRSITKSYDKLVKELDETID